MNSSRLHLNSPSRSDTAAFTLTDLLVVFGVLLILGVLLVPARAASRMRTHGIVCLDNLRQIMNAMSLYTRDNHDFFPPNPDDASASVGHNWCSGSAGVGGAAQFNPDFLANPTRCLIATYLKSNISYFLCPADTRSGIYQGTDPALAGKRVPAARSISMNTAVGTICAGFDAGSVHSGKPTLSVNGSWLDNNHAHRRNSPWRTYGKLSETFVPGPAQLWVVGEEDVYSLNDACFSIGMNVSEWIDFPGTRHNYSCVFAFVDGHGELHKWADPRTQVVGGNVTRKSVPNSLDWQWITSRTSAKMQ